MLNRSGRISVFSLLLFLGTAAVAAAQADVVITTTGERLVGEIIRVEKDVLTLSTGYSDSDFKIEWDKVARIQAKGLFEVVTQDGRRLLGPLRARLDGKSPVDYLDAARLREPDDRAPRDAVQETIWIG